MKFTPRPYQQEAIEAGTSFLKSKKKENGIIILATGSGKSIVIANTIAPLEGNTIILQPSKEILEQNFSKYISYGFRAGIYSASAGHKHIDRVTFATIGSIIKKKHLFSGTKNILIDECHKVNAADGMYRDFVDSLPDAKVLGFTATPYRLATGMEGSQLRFLTRTSPRVFNKVLYYVQNDVLFNGGYLSKLRYFDVDVIDRKMLDMNANGSDFTQMSMRKLYDHIGMNKIIIDHANRLLLKRKNLLIFTSLVADAVIVSQGVPGSIVITGETETGKRSQILSQFKSGKIKCVINVGVLTTGFDYPELECVLDGASTMSLALYYQKVGRLTRTHAMKEDGWYVDLGGNFRYFGAIESLKIGIDSRGLYHVSNNGRQLTNVTFTKE